MLIIELDKMFLKITPSTDMLIMSIIKVIEQKRGCLFYGQKGLRNEADS